MRTDELVKIVQSGIDPDSDACMAIVARLRAAELTRSERRILEKYGEDLCLKAYRMHEDGMGGYTVGYILGYHTNTADALINVGQKLVEG